MKAIRRCGQGAATSKFIPMPGEHTAMGWPVDETGLTELLVASTATTASALVITENGAAYNDVVLETVTSTTPTASPTSGGISRRLIERSQTASTCAATTCGR